MAKSEKITEKKVKEPVHDGLNTEDEHEKTSVPARKSSPFEEKKKSKKTVTPAEEPTINITDLHEKLTKLLDLKEKGMISAAEYEKRRMPLLRAWTSVNYRNPKLL